jgi:hypothetical protein
MIAFSQWTITDSPVLLFTKEEKTEKYKHDQIQFSVQ